MDNIQHILDIIVDNPIYLILIVSLALMIAWSLIKKLYKLAIIFGVCSVVYFVYVYVENPKETKEKVRQSGKYIEETAKDLYNNSPIPKEIKKGGKYIEEKAKELVPEGVKEKY